MTVSNAYTSTEAALIKATDLFVTRVHQVLSSRTYPQDDQSGRGLIPIQDSIVVGKPIHSDGKVSILITFGGPKAPYAPAYEYGSGLEGPSGEKYIIAPVKAQALMFNFRAQFWPPAKKFVMFLSASKKEVQNNFDNNGFFEGESLWNYVEHPGIEGRPYIRPTLEDLQPEIRKIMAKEIKAIMNYTRKKEETIRV